jgi:mannose-6-phosphate isomerase-like protein (cupin superfamily)
MSEQAGKVLDLRAVFGLTATIVTPASVADGEAVVMDVVAEPGARTTIHRHPEQDETYQVLVGRLEVYHDGTWHSVREGETLVMARGEVHGFRNPNQTPVRFRNTHHPALRFQDHLEMLDRLVKDGKITGTRDPRSLMYMSMSAMEFRPDVSVKPPQRLVQFLAFLGRRLGLSLPQHKDLESQAS